MVVVSFERGDIDEYDIINGFIVNNDYNDYFDESIICDFALKFQLFG